MVYGIPDLRLKADQII